MCLLRENDAQSAFSLLYKNYIRKIFAVSGEILSPALLTHGGGYVIMIVPLLRVYFFVPIFRDGPAGAAVGKPLCNEGGLINR